MECNKEEAVRAKAIAKEKMESKDFIGARKLAILAQRLFPNIEHVSQMITVCEIHCSASVKKNGIEDWYGILQVEPSADETTIKKQYRKLVRSLHPDKNKFVGAEAAFKMVGDAHRILSDSLRRSAYDVQRTSIRHAGRKAPGQPASSFAEVPYQCSNNIRIPKTVQPNGLNHHQQQHSEGEPAEKTIWTSCPYCLIRYRYYQSVVNKSLRCQYCMRRFIAIDIHAQNEDSGPTGMGTSCMSKPQNVGCLQSCGLQVRNSLVVLKRKWMADETVKSYHSHSTDVAEAFSAAAAAKNVHKVASFKKQRLDATFVIDQHQASSHKDMCGMECQNWRKINGESRSKQAGVSRDEQNVWQDGIIREGMNSMPDLKVDLSVPDPDFYDFELERNRSSFSVGQVWALYDDFDEMPRFYAEIKKVSSHGFKVLFTWLEYNPANKTEKHWHARKLPVGCGNYKSGRAQKSKEIAMFSHLMPFEKGAGRNSYQIHPRKGEIWALYEDWDIRWAFEPENHEGFSFQIVEIVSDNLTGVGIRLLHKLEGFVSVFTKSPDEVNGAELVHVPPNELLRFSHMIPSCKLTGKEREGIPEGSYELDTAALPSKFHSSTSNGHAIAANTSINLCSVQASERTENASVERCTPLNNQRGMPPGVINHENQWNKEGAMMKDLNHNSEVNRFGCENVKTGRNVRDGTPPLQCLGNSKDVVRLSNAGCVGSKMATDSLFAPKFSNLAGLQFHQFDKDKSFHKVQSGQIWALYGELDGFPRYYALIRDVDVGPPKVNVIWLEPCPELIEEVRWFDNGLPFGCGKFMPLTGKDDRQIYDTLEVFSHQVITQTSGEQKTYNIYPCVGDIWAMYKNWSAEWKVADFSNCEYQVVEIFAAEDHMIKIQFLDKVEGFFTVFTRRSGMLITADIPLTDMLKFSHRIPSFVLTDEMGGEVRGSWELDPASLPDMVLCPRGQ